MIGCYFFFFSSRRRHTRYWRDWSSDVCSSDLVAVVHRLEEDDLVAGLEQREHRGGDRLGGPGGDQHLVGRVVAVPAEALHVRSEERRVGKECRSRWSPYH